MNKLQKTFLILLCLFLATIATAGPSILQIYMGGTGASTAAQALINLIGGSPSVGQAVVWNGTAWVPGTSGGGSGGSGITPFDTPVPATSIIPYYGMDAWFSADCPIISDAGSCGAPANGTSIDVWADRSGQGGFAAANTTPCVYNTNQINSKPAMTFSGSCGEYLISSNLINRNTWRDALTVFLVAKLAATGSNMAYLGGGTNGDVEYRANTAKEQELLKENTNSLGEGTAAADTSWHQMNFSCTTSTNIAAVTVPAFRINRATDTTLPNSTILSCSTLGFNNARITDIGYDGGSGAEVLNGSIAEIIIYGRILSSTEFTEVESYLHTKYGL
jgi:hypothetical protein